MNALVNISRLTFIEQAIAKVNTMQGLSYALGAIDMAVEAKAITLNQAAIYMQDARKKFDGFDAEISYLAQAQAANKAEDDAFWAALLAPEVGYVAPPCPDFSLLQSRKADELSHASI